MLLQGMEKNRGGWSARATTCGNANEPQDAPRSNIVEPRDTSPTLSDIGITKRQSSEYQQLASIPTTEMDARVEEQKAEGKPPTRTTILKPHVPHHPASDWGGDSLQRNAHGTSSELVGFLLWQRLSLTFPFLHDQPGKQISFVTL